MSQRGGLNLSPDGRLLYVPFGGYNDRAAGWMVAVDTVTPALASAFSGAPSTDLEANGGMWASGGPAVDEAGQRLLHHGQHDDQYHECAGLLEPVGAGVGTRIAATPDGHLHAVELLPDGSVRHRSLGRRGGGAARSRRGQHEHAASDHVRRQAGQSVPGGPRSYAGRPDLASAVQHRSFDRDVADASGARSRNSANGVR